MTDNYLREITYLRLSLTDLCNLHCVYCRPSADNALFADSSSFTDKGCSTDSRPSAGSSPSTGSRPSADSNSPAGSSSCLRRESLSAARAVQLVKAAAHCGIRKVRLTGGEPLLRADILSICRSISRIPGIETLCITTNGTLLKDLAVPLREAGVSRVNISLDTLDPRRYKALTGGGDLKEALAGLEAALAAGIPEIRINTVLMQDQNSSELKALAELTKTKGIDVRFIELMPIGAGTELFEKHYLSTERIMELLPDLIPIGRENVMRTYRLPGAKGLIGLISPISGRFCDSCNRIRITAGEMLKPCLHSTAEIPLSGLSGDALEDAIRQGILAKPGQHHLAEEKASRSRSPMYRIGG